MLSLAVIKKSRGDISSDRGYNPGSEIATAGSKPVKAVTDHGPVSHVVSGVEFGSEQRCNTRRPRWH
jgi:hypothetical protein